MRNFCLLLSFFLISTLCLGELPALPEGWSPELWKACWNEKDQWVDFTSDSWVGLEIAQQIALAQSYQKWYAKKLDTTVENKVEVQIKLSPKQKGITVAFDMVLIPPGKFFMGSSEEEKGSQKADRPCHNVIISKPFWMSKYEVTQEQWEKVTKETPWLEKQKPRGDIKAGPAYPASYIDRQTAESFIKKIGNKFSMPTEAQWEYACRAGTLSIYYWGQEEPELDKYTWTQNTVNAEYYPREVGKKLPNPWQLYDMIGNMSEFCSDWYYDGYENKEETDPIGPTDSRKIGYGHVVRGGHIKDYPVNCRSASRTREEVVFTGLRLVKE